ncbi:MAG: hypothetical protein JJT90_15920 [Ectothiorhodospiraceae bacterium]|nr:hypothetical protein [Ectothiorhodospiraceae bacterium]
MVRCSGPVIILLWVLLAVCLPSAAQQTEVVRAYPAVYDLSRLADGQREMLVSGDVLLMEGDAVRVAEPSAGPAGNHRITLDLGVQRSEQAPRRLAVSLVGEIVVLTGERRMELDDRDGFIAGPETQRISFESQNWLSLDDPSPLEAVHQQGDVSYVFTLMLQDVAYR